MHHGPARVLAIIGVLAAASASVACVDQARCDAAVEGVAQARAEGERRDRQLAWLGLWQAQLAAQTQGGTPLGGGDAEREALRQRVALLEAENAALTVRLDRAEQKLGATSSKRRLDPSVPYPLTTSLDRPPASGKHEGSILRRAARPSRKLDPVVPYEPGSGAVTQAPPAAPPATRMLDEDVPY